MIRDINNNQNNKKETLQIDAAVENCNFLELFNNMSDIVKVI